MTWKPQSLRLTFLSNQLLLHAEDYTQEERERMIKEKDQILDELQEYQQELEWEQAEEPWND
jgi:hypothetical protein